MSECISSREEQFSELNKTDNYCIKADVEFVRTILLLYRIMRSNVLLLSKYIVYHDDVRLSIRAHRSKFTIPKSNL